MRMRMWVWNVTEFFEPLDGLNGISDTSVSSVVGVGRKYDGFTHSLSSQVQFHYVNPDLMYSLYVVSVYAVASLTIELCNLL